VAGADWHNGRGQSWWGRVDTKTVVIGGVGGLNRWGMGGGRGGGGGTRYFLQRAAGGEGQIAGIHGGGRGRITGGGLTTMGENRKGGTQSRVFGGHGD